MTFKTKSDPILEKNIGVFEKIHERFVGVVKEGNKPISMDEIVTLTDFPDAEYLLSSLYIASINSTPLPTDDNAELFSETYKLLIFVFEESVILNLLILYEYIYDMVVKRTKASDILSRVVANIKEDETMKAAALAGVTVQSMTNILIE